MKIIDEVRLVGGKNEKRSSYAQVFLSSVFLTLFLTSAAIFVGLLVGCSTNQEQDSIAIAAIGLTNAERAASVYTHLPRCIDGPEPCAKQDTVDRIKAADQVAYDAIKAAEKSGNASAAAEALSALNSILAEPDVQTAIRNVLKQRN